MSIAALVRPVTRAPVIDITIPVYNEERALAPAVRRLHAHVNGDFPYLTRITIADNASTDRTAAPALKLATELPDIRLVRSNQKEKGRAVAASWLTSDAQVVAYMDVDLSTDLSALLPLVAPIILGHSDVSVGRRLVPSVLNRSWFFDTELLVQAERAGFRVYELPVDWIEDADSRVDLVATSLENLQGVWRLATDRWIQSASARPRLV